MDYAALLRELSGASLFDLHRLRAVLDQMTDDPARIENVKARLRIGMRISYFEASENRLIEAVVLELHRTRLLVENVADKQRWKILYAMVNLDGVHADVPPIPGTTDRTAWSVGDSVAFRDKQNQDRYGTIVSLNSKTATVILKNDQKWRVAYSLLIPVWAGDPQARNHGSQDALPLLRKPMRIIEACKPETGPFDAGSNPASAT